METHVHLWAYLKLTTVTLLLLIILGTPVIHRLSSVYNFRNASNKVKLHRRFNNTDKFSHINKFSNGHT